MPASGKPLPFEAQPEAQPAASPIPNRSLFKASEVCEIAHLQPYILRSWENEFQTLGVTRTPGGARVYRRSDVERVFEIKRLLFDEGLTLAGVRRRLEADTPAVGSTPIEELLGPNARERLGEVKRGLLSILDLLSKDASGGNGHAAAAAMVPVRTAPRARVRAPKPGKAAKGAASRGRGKSKRR
jgi:DNA-binding transcriptional MerR regulator